MRSDHPFDHCDILGKSLSFPKLRFLICKIKQVTFTLLCKKDSLVMRTVPDTQKVLGEL